MTVYCPECNNVMVPEPYTATYYCPLCDKRFSWKEYIDRVFKPEKVIFT